MTFDWQDLAALGVVAVAVAYLARLGIAAVSRRGDSAGGCGSGCGSCPVGPSSTAGRAHANGKGGPLVTIGPPPSPSKRDR
jgi:hypothetical protein